MDEKTRAGKPLGNDRLLSLDDVSQLLGCCPATASKVLRETGCAVRLHRRLYILESSLLRCLANDEVA